MVETLAVGSVVLIGGLVVGVVIALLIAWSYPRAAWTRTVAPMDAPVDVDEPPPVTDPLDARWTLPDERVLPLYFQQLVQPAAPDLDTPSAIFPRNWMDAL